MAKISRRLLVKTLLPLLQHPADQGHIARQLAAYLIMHKQTHQLDALIKDVERELLLHEGTLYADVASAFGLDASLRKTVQHYLQVATGAHRVELTEATDPALLSGLILRTADSELDTSAQYKLRHLANLTTGGNEL